MGTRVYIGRLSYHARDKDIERFFRGYGRIRDIMLKNGYGFVEFDDYRDADDAVYELNGKELCGERIVIEHARGSERPPAKRNFMDKVSVEHARGPRSDDFRDRGFRGRRGGGGGREKYGPPTRTEYRLIVENLSSRVSWQDLKDYMRQAGEVTYADAHKKHRNEGIIEFASFGDLKNAMDKLDGTEINGRKIRLIEDKPRKRSTSRSRSRSRRRSRSRSRSKSNSRSRSHSPSHSRSRSGSKDKKSKSKSRSRSPSPARKKSASKSHSRSRSRSRSRSPEKENGGDDNDERNMDD